MKSMNKFNQRKIWISSRDVHARSRTKNNVRSLGAVGGVHQTFLNTLHIQGVQKLTLPF